MLSGKFWNSAANLSNLRSKCDATLILKISYKNIGKTQKPSRFLSEVTFANCDIGNFVHFDGFKLYSKF